MESQILERVRCLEADIERHRDEIVLEQLVPCSHYRHQLLRDHYIADRIRLIQSKAEKLLELRDDDEDLETVRAQRYGFEAAVAAIERRVAEMREYLNTTRDAGRPIVADEIEDIHLTLPRVESLFTAPESHGRCFDLQPHYNMLKTVVQEENKTRQTPLLLVPYREYVLKIVETFSTQLLPVASKKTHWNYYRKYVIALRDYLVDFHRRRCPLAAPLRETTLKETERRVREQWSRGGVKFWESDARASIPDAIDVAVAERQVHALLENVLADVVTATHDALTRRERRTADELMRAEEADNADFMQSLAASATIRKQRLRANVSNISTAAAATGGGAGGVAHAADYDVGDIGGAGARDDNDGAGDQVEATNLDGALLDDNGQPIPYYIVKMHGLLRKFPCDLCGGEVYNGPKVFREHFCAERHTDALRSIGIENSRVFEGVTTMGEALDLHRALPRHPAVKRFHDDVLEEEREDVNGLIITKKRMEELHQRV